MKAAKIMAKMVRLKVTSTDFAAALMSNLRQSIFQNGFSLGDQNRIIFATAEILGSKVRSKAQNEAECRQFKCDVR